MNQDQTLTQQLDSLPQTEQDWIAQIVEREKAKLMKEQEAERKRQVLAMRRKAFLDSWKMRLKAGAIGTGVGVVGLAGLMLLKPGDKPQVGQTTIVGSAGEAAAVPGSGATNYRIKLKDGSVVQFTSPVDIGQQVTAEKTK